MNKPEQDIIYPEKNDLSTGNDNFASDIYKGLASPPRSVPSQHLYDDEGSQLFQEIMNLEEYYVTDCEEEILKGDSGEILKNVPDTFTLIDIGAGDGQKSLHLLREAFNAGKQVTFVPVDISAYAVNILKSYVEKHFPGIAFQGLVMTYKQAFQWLENNISGPKLTLFLGGNIGNFPKTEAREFLQAFLTFMDKEDYLLIGFDLKKDPEIIHAAYNDKKGITGAFNLNLLKRINRELNGNITIDQFTHFSDYNPFTGIVNSYIISKAKQAIEIPGINLSFTLSPWETIHTEYSVKYSIEEIDKLAWESGFSSTTYFKDERLFFANALWKLKI